MLCACKEANHSLTSQSQVSIQIDNFLIRGDLDITVERSEFEEAATDLFERMMMPVTNLLNGLKYAPNQMQEIILVGGPARIPKIRQMLVKHFGKALKYRGNLDEAVAEGAAMYAALSANPLEPIGGVLSLKLIVPQTLGMRVNGGIMCRLIPRGKLIPASYDKNFTSQSAYH